jgi:8-oxo-dGTP diphosphatase
MDNLSYIVNVEAAIYKNGKWLIIKRSEKEEHAPGLLAMVGGKVETEAAENNVLEETLRREIMEEVGIEVSKTLHYVESKSFISDQGQAVIDIVFLCEYQSGEPKCISADEVSEIYWMSSTEIFEHKNVPVWLKESIEKADNIRLEVNK